MFENAVNLAGRHLVVGLPCYTGVVPQPLMDALIRTTSALRKHGVTLTISARTGSGIVDKVRDELIHSFLTRTEGTDLLFLDDDVTFEPDDVLRLMAWATSRELVVGPYCTKEEPENFLYGLDGDENGKIVQDSDGLLRVLTAPAGFMLLRRSALEKMRSHYTDLQYKPKRGEFNGETVTALCMMFLEDQPDGTRSRIGEDIALCKRWTALSGEIWLDPAIELGHIGRKEYRKPYIEWLKGRSANQKKRHVSDVHTKECKHGKFSWLTNDTFIGRSMELYGEWAEAELHTLLPFVRAGDVVIDVGANIGTHTIPIAKKVGRFGLVYAFEPQDKVFEILEQNVSSNDLGNSVVASMSACSDKSGRAILAKTDYSRSGNFGALSLSKMAGVGRTVSVLALDSLKEDISRYVSLIKIDVEGMEASVLLGAKQIIKRDRPVLFVENNSTEHAREIIDALCDVADNYVMYWHVAPYFNKNSWRTNKVNVFEKYRPEFNMLAVPEELAGNVSADDPSLVPFSEELSDWRKAHEAWLAAKSIRDAA